MSLASFLGSTFGGLVQRATGALDKLAGNTGLIKAAGDGLTSWATREQNKSDLNDARNWQMYTQTQANQFAHDEAQLSRDFNALEAEKNRQFQSNEAASAREQARQWQLEDWQRETQYNSPANQLKLMQAAGLNPLLFNESVSNASMPSAVSSSAPSGSSATSSPASSSLASLSLSNPSFIAAQTNLANQQAKNLEYQNEKLSADTDLSKEQANDLRALRQGKLDMQNVEIHLGLSSERVNDATIRKMYKDCLLIDSNIQLASQSLANMQQELSNLQTQGLLDEKRLQTFDKELQSRLALALSEQAKNYGLVDVSRKQCELLAEQVTGQSISNGLISIDFSRAFNTMPSGTKLIVSSNEHQQSIYDFETGAFLKNVWNGDGSVPYKVFRSATGYGAWLSSCLSMSLSGNVSGESFSKKNYFISK